MKTKPETFTNSDETLLLFPRPGPLKLIGPKVNKSESAALQGVSLTTVDNWCRRGCPVHERTPHEVFFDVARVDQWLLFYRDKDGGGLDLIRKSREEIADEVAGVKSRFSVWFQGHRERQQCPKLCIAMLMFDVLTSLLYDRPFTAKELEALEEFFWGKMTDDRRDDK